MSTYDPEEVRKLQDRIDAASAAHPASLSPEEIQARTEAEHRARQERYEAPADPPSGKVLHLRDLPPVSGTPGIKGKAAKIILEVDQTGEPIFILRAKDIFSVMAVANYIELLTKYGPEAHDMVIGATEQLEVMKQWQRSNVDKVRYPD